MQLPLFNEMYVVERLLDAVVGIRYPRDRFQVQVLDDSTDETQEICQRKVAELRARIPELDIEYIHRNDRTGFKAGALENGLHTAKGELILIFDADFLPQPDMLERTVDHFVDPKVAMVQCRWEHLNRDFSALTEAQALMLDGHFVMEHAGRAWSGRFFNFNGTAGCGGASAIAEAGGWQHDTLTEDMDLSYRAQLLRLEVHLHARGGGPGRAAGRDVGVQGAAVPLGQGLDAGGARSCCRASCARTPPGRRSPRRSST